MRYYEIITESIDYLTLYHGTSDFSLKQIQKDGFIGITEDVLLQYFDKIFNKLKVPNDKKQLYYKRAKTELEEYAPNGQVSFWQSSLFMKDYTHIISDRLGEAFGHDLKNSIKYASRVTQTDYKENLKKFPFLTKKNKAVELQVKVPINLIVNKNQIGKNTELYTSGVVPAKFITNIIYI